MRRNGVTMKLFLVMAGCLVLLYGTTVFAQLVWFPDFYQHQKVSSMKKKLSKFEQQYSNGHWSDLQLAKETGKFMRQNQSHLVILTNTGRLVNDPFHITLLQEDGSHVKVSLSLFINSENAGWITSHLKYGQELTVRGPASESMVYPFKIQDATSAAWGTESFQESIEPVKEWSGVLTEVVLPNLATWSQRQGLLVQALDSRFPLSTEDQLALANGKMLNEEWMDSWSGVRNVITIAPVHRSGPEQQLIFSLTSLQEMREANEATRLFYAYFGIGAFILILLLALLLSRIVTKPLLALNHVAKKMSTLDFTVKSPIRRNDEIGSLSNSLNALSGTLGQTLEELRQANTQMRTDMEMKQEIEQRQRKFFADASHELKTPISIIKGYSEGLKDGVSESKRERYIEIIADEAIKMETMVEEMLDLVRLESSAVQLNTDAVALADMIEDIAGRLGPQLKDKGLDVVLVSTTEQTVEGDRSKLEQVIFNIMMNAIRHAIPHTDITIEISRREGFVHISIENKGEHIAEAERQYIWERFYRVERSRNRKMGGTGLGLAIAKQILDLHGCSYGVENTPDGVRFYIIFPKA
ncbi:sensor histidine kinase [Paenibacillus polymyxa]|uniref:sensor histidine kinase n=1 Tax=Paenibacillus TaxID=44249 RepID=UPI00088A2493|nr:MULTISPECIES: HAMP domain-containing sensor histidine kinase [Paenibacillus]TDL62448.1 HAMP domain-containing histidine kinase [Paenibacillus amylolyticus]WJM07641.1 HAMP domain-containing sensor histidine kinase [Paenibacillus sp. PK1-4R]SDD80839.1 Signal transduction histidine kinase [Paenibacillus sp. CF095]